MKLTVESLKSLVSKISGAALEDIADNTSLIHNLYMDSIKIVELLAILEDDYAISIDEEQALNFDTFGDLQALVGL